MIKKLTIKENVNHYVDTQGVMGEVGELYTKYDLINYWKENKNSDPCLMEYNSMYDWLEDTLDFMELVNDLQESVRRIKESNEERHWLNTELPNYMSLKLKNFLRDNKIKFESSGVGRTLTHFEIFATKDEANMINDFIDSIDIDGPSTPYTEARIGKTKEVKVLQGNWGYGWDDLGEYELTDNECKDDLKVYRENDPSATYRVIKRRVTNPAYTEGCHGKKRAKKRSTVKESAWVSPNGTKYGKQKRGSGYDYRFSTRELKDMISKGIAKEIKDADKAWKLKDEIIGISWNETNGYTSGVLFKDKDGNLYIGLSGVAPAIV